MGKRRAFSRPALGGGKAILLVVPTARKGPGPSCLRGQQSYSSWRGSVRLVLREVPGLGRRVRHATVIVRSVKLGRKASSQARPTRSRGQCSRSDPRRSCSNTILAQRGGATQRVRVRCQVPARSQMVHRAPPMSWRQHYVQWPKRVKDKRATQPAPEHRYSGRQRPFAAREPRA